MYALENIYKKNIIFKSVHWEKIGFLCSNEKRNKTYSLLMENSRYSTQTMN